MFKAASAAAVGLTALTAIAVTVPGLAQATPGDVIYEPLPVTSQVTVAAETAGDPVAPAEVAVAEPAEPAAAPPPPPASPMSHESLTAMVRAIAHREPETDALRCIATGVFYESRSESVEGQLAVAHVIINRANSGRFASTPCGVLTQRGQFSFVRGGVVPTAPAGRQWQTAVAIARIAQAEDWRNPAPGAMFFHATRVSPGWNRQRVATLGNHVFYR